MTGLALKDDRPPWARQPKERESAWLAFQGFLAMAPPRSVSGFAEISDKAVTTLYQWSGRWRWLERAEQYDGFLQRSKDEAMVLQRREMNERHATLARAMSAKVAERIRALDADELSPGEVGRWMQVISMVERLALGEASEIVQRQGGPDTVVNVNSQEVEAVIFTPDDYAEVLERLGVPVPTDIPLAGLPDARDLDAGTRSEPEGADDTADEPIHPGRS